MPSSSEYGRQWRETQKRLGLCPTCGGKREDADRVTCRNCRRRKSLNNTLRREKRAREGLCVVCGAPLDKRAGRLTCEDCLQKEREAKQNDKLDADSSGSAQRGRPKNTCRDARRDGA